MIAVETVPGIQEGGWKRAVDGVNSNRIHMIHCKNVRKYSNVDPLSITIIKKMLWGKPKSKIIYSFLYHTLKIHKKIIKSYLINFKNVFIFYTLWDIIYFQIILPSSRYFIALYYGIIYTSWHLWFSLHGLLILWVH
jgi:hypothetical protein